MVHHMKGVISSSILFLACFQVAAGQSDSDAETLLREHSNEFLPELIQVTDRVYVASGYGASNSAMIVGDTGLIIIDTRESKSAARAVLEQFRTVTDKPVKAIVYTHGHVDHTNGTTEFVGNEQPEIYARDNFRAKLMTDSDVFPVLMKRTVRQFGFALSPDQYINMGLGVKAIRDHEGDGYLPPTIRFADERFTVTIDGVDVELVAAPGETDDQLYVWLPDDRVLFPGDNFYKAFPNLYPIRGAAYRDVKVWADSLQKMRTEGAEYLIPSHTRPISGAESVDEALRVYAEAIRYVYDETISGMNKGMTADQLAASISLPDELAESPYLQEFYGSLEWGVRSVFSGLVGWFDGNPTNLRPLNNAEEAARIVELAGGADEVFATLGAATDADDFQWALQLADYLLAVEYRVADVTAIKVDALRGIAALQSNATARNYYLTVANEMERK